MKKICLLGVFSLVVTLLLAMPAASLTPQYWNGTGNTTNAPGGARGTDVLGTANADDLRLITAGTERMMIDGFTGTGNVGIGLALAGGVYPNPVYPASKLHVDTLNPTTPPGFFTEISRVGYTFTTPSLVGYGIGQGIYGAPSGDWPAIQTIDDTQLEEYGFPLYIQPMGGGTYVMGGTLGIGTDATSATLHAMDTSTNVRIARFEAPSGTQNNNIVWIGSGDSDGSYNLLSINYGNSYMYNAMTVKGNGNVGIGTTGPVSTLEVDDDSTQLTLNNSGEGEWVDFHADENGYLIISPTGEKVGIGTASPNAVLHVKDTSPSAEIAKFEAPSGTQNQNNDVVWIGGGGTSPNPNNQYNLLNIEFGPSYSSSALVVRGDGHVGIGDPNPAYELSVFGKAFILNNVGIGALDPKQKLVVDYGNVGIGYNDATQTAQLAVKGRVGIGITSPGQPLHVKDTNPSANIARFEAPSGIQTGVDTVRISGGGTSVTSYNLLKIDYGPSYGSIAMVVNGDGEVGIGTADPKATFSIANKVMISDSTNPPTPPSNSVVIYFDNYDLKAKNSNGVVIKIADFP